jgi:hypothetical protein
MSFGLKVTAGLLFIPLLGAGIYASYLNGSHVEQKRIYVGSKERLLRLSTDKDGNTTSSYQNFVYATDETYVVQDSLWNGHFRAGTVYAQVRERAQCDVTVVGYRIGFFSLYQNIIAVQCDASEGSL